VNVQVEIEQVSGDGQEDMIKKILKREESLAIVNTRDRRKGLKGIRGSKAVLSESSKSVTSASGGSRGEVKPPEDTRAEHHLVIQTSPEGYNMGRRYVNRVPEGEVELWLSDVTELTKQAKARAKTEALQAISAQNPVDAYRDRVRRFYEFRSAPRCFLMHCSSACQDLC
jgi:hypothetical protein